MAPTSGALMPPAAPAAASAVQPTAELLQIAGDVESPAAGVSSSMQDFDDVAPLTPDAVKAVADGSTTAQLQVGTTAQHEPISLVQGEMSADQCFRYFNPETDTDYDNTVREWSDAILTLAKEV